MGTLLSPHCPDGPEPPGPVCGLTGGALACFPPPPLENAVRRSFLVPLLLLLPLGGCVVSLVSFLVPSTVLAGSTFEVVVVGNQTAGNLGDQLGAVLQIPAGFTLLGAMTPTQPLGSPMPVTFDDPAIPGLYAGEPGTALHSFSGGTIGTSPPTVALRVRLQAPPGGGVFTLKVALAATLGGAWQAQDPAGVVSFASIVDAAHTRSLTVLATPVSGAPSWVDDSFGLPLYSAEGWGGVAFGDVNVDGLEDLACVARLGDGPHVFLRAPGGWTESSLGLLGSSGRSEVAFGDFDGDGLLDLAHGNGNAWLGDGGISWTPANAGLSLAGDGEGVAVGDVNGDGFDDVAISGHFSPYLQCFLSNANGTWTASSAGLPTTQPPSAGVSGGHKLLMRDIDGDGNLDLVWARLNAPGVWLGNGVGAWSEVVGNGMEPLNAFGVDAADLDGDGDLDLVFGVVSVQGTASAAGVRVYRRQVGLQWVYDPASGFPSTGGYHDVAAADVDRDGIVDVVAGRAGAGLELWRGVGGGTFSLAPTTLSANLPDQWIGPAEGIAVGDVDGDTFPEIALASYDMGVAVFANEITGVSFFGEGCPGPAGPFPSIGTSGAPVLGNGSFAWTLIGPAPGLPAVLILGASARLLGGLPLLPLPLAPFGAAGCSLLVSPDVLIPAALGPAGTASLTTPVPNDPSLLLGTAFGQWAVAFPGANPLGAVFSGAAAARIGS